MIQLDSSGSLRFRAVTRANVDRAPQWWDLPPEVREGVKVVSAVLPFRTNEYVMQELIDWTQAPDDPIFRLTFPQKGMLSGADYERMARLVRADAPKEAIEAEANRIRLKLNPHPAGQLTHNVPELGGQDLPGIQHKYPETVLFFPAHGQTCHAYCTFCFRWAQFVGMEDLKFAAREVDQLVRYIRSRPLITDVLITGGDPMVMKTSLLQAYIEPLLKLGQISTIRIGTKSVAYWPHRYVSDTDAEDLLYLFERVVGHGKQLALMGHYCHPAEISTEVAEEAVRRIRSTGANIRMQSPIVRRINDSPQAWAELWQRGVRLGCIPYYMFVERNTGSRDYFEIPLARCWNIFRAAYRQVSGMARTVRGPSMSAFPGKVHVLGITTIGRHKAFVLEYLQARRPELVRRPFFARYDAQATWWDQLQPLTAADREFFPAGNVGSPTVEVAAQGRPNDD